MKKILVIYGNYTPAIDAILYQIQNLTTIELVKEEDYNPSKYSDEYFLVCIKCKTKINNSVAVFHSLNLNLSEKNPVKNAILTGQKITGITIYNTNDNRIIAQYPVFIKHETHYDDLISELEYLEQTLFPKVIEKIIQNEPFETQELLQNHSKCSKCGGCKSCTP